MKNKARGLFEQFWLNKSGKQNDLLIKLVPKILILKGHYYTRISILILFFTGISSVLYGQVELTKVTPLSPNAASIVRYGETPIGHFTGTPNIGIPVWTVSTGQLSLPLSLSYHGGGIKVEDIASSVGLGWSLGGLPSISRMVMNLPDESTGGFYHKYNGLPISTHWNQAQESGSPPSTGVISGGEITMWTQLVYQGDIDLEPDIFNYNLLSESGVFFYNQETESFHKRPMNQIQITRNDISNTFVIVDERGVKYFFDQKESTGYNSTSQTVASTWYVSKIVNANRTDSLVFEYNLNAYYSRSMNSEMVHLGGPSAPELPISVINGINEMLIDRIVYPTGYVKFNYNPTQREDLPGSYALSNIQVFDNNSGLLKKVELNQSYWMSNSGGSRCLVANAEEKKRMFLDSISIYGNSNTNPLRYSFEYNKPSDMPCRLSAAQDYWGFYNGKNSNATLIPTTYLFSSGIYNGADRSVDPTKSQMGILTKITYPTGGHTEFVYENNQASQSVTSLPANYVTDGVALGDRGPEFQENLPIYFHEISDSFTIQNGSDPVLNGNSGLGGVIVTVYAGQFGCELNGQANICADIKLIGTNGYVRYIFGDEQFHIPNGTYYIDASFNQDPPNYGEFYVVITYKKIQTVDGYPLRYAGGLRIKTIKDFDQTSLVSERSFRYTNGINSNESSGQIFGSSYLNFKTDMPLGIRLESRPAMQMVRESGSYIGYYTVIEENVSSEESGYTQYEFTNAPNEGSYLFPYPPAICYKFLRGQPVKTSFYKKTANGFLLVQDVNYQYQDVVVDEVGMAVKLAYYYDTSTPGVTFQAIKYDLGSGWSKISKQTERTFDATGTDYVAIETSFEYDEEHLLLSKTIATNSSGENIITNYYYPQDLSLTGESEGARGILLARNNISEVMKKEIFKGVNHLQTVSTKYTILGLNDMVLPSLYVEQNLANPEEPRVEFLNYDNQGRILEQRLSSNLIHSYIWDNTGSYPLAEAVNTTSDNIYHTSFEENGTVETVSNPARTGKRYLNTGTYNFSENGFVPASATNLKMSYWYWSSNKWNFSGIVNWNNTINAGTRLDEIRVFPGDSHMTTYTYDTGIGLTSMTDGNGVTTYYNYDSFGRLKLVKDDKGNILKQYTYNYKHD